jgi:hypothetical protein
LAHDVGASVSACMRLARGGRLCGDEGADRGAHGQRAGASTRATAGWGGCADMRGPGAEGESGRVAEGGAPTGQARRAEREEGGGGGRGCDGPTGPKGQRGEGAWASFLFLLFLYSDFLFLFIFSFGFQFKHATNSN